MLFTVFVLLFSILWLIETLTDEKGRVSVVFYCHIHLFIVAKHPNMQEVVMCEVERMLYRPNVSEKAQ